MYIPGVNASWSCLDKHIHKHRTVKLISVLLMLCSVIALTCLSWPPWRLDTVPFLNIFLCVKQMEMSNDVAFRDNTHTLMHVSANHVTYTGTKETTMTIYPFQKNTHMHFNITFKQDMHVSVYHCQHTL